MFGIQSAATSILFIGKYRELFKCTGQFAISSFQFAVYSIQYAYLYIISVLQIFYSYFLSLRSLKRDTLSHI